MSLDFRKAAWFAFMLLIVVANLSNLGIMRAIFSFVLFPYFVVVARVNWNFLKIPEFGTGHAVVFLAALSIYAGFSMVMPDGGDIGQCYVFFGRIKFDPSGDGSWWMASMVLFVASVLLTVFEFLELRAQKKARLEELRSHRKW
jgi:hypothetical protein